MPSRSHILQQADIDAIASSYFTNGDISLGDIDGVPTLSAPLFKEHEPSYIATAKLIVGEKPYLVWTDQTTEMLSRFDQEHARGSLADGTYKLDSAHFYEVKITSGVPTRADFADKEDAKAAKCNAEAKSFTMEDPGLKRISTYIQVTPELIIEFSHNRGGHAMLWRLRK